MDVCLFTSDVVIGVRLCTSDAFSLHVLGRNFYGCHSQLAVASMKANNVGLIHSPLSKKSTVKQALKHN
jgi:hypothetical protein